MEIADNILDVIGLTSQCAHLNCGQPCKPPTIEWKSGPWPSGVKAEPVCTYHSEELYLIWLLDGELLESGFVSPEVWFRLTA